MTLGFSDRDQHDFGVLSEDLADLFAGVVAGVGDGELAELEFFVCG